MNMFMKIFMNSGPKSPIGGGSFMNIFMKGGPREHDP